MTDTVSAPADLFRQGSRRALAAALTDARNHTLTLVEALATALAPTWEIRYLPEWSPPLWLLGQLAWQEDWWISRNPLRRQGVSASASAPRAPADWPGWDKAFAPGLSHPARWHQALPDARTVLDHLRCSRERSLSLLAQAGDDARSLAVFRQQLWHEDRLRETLLGLCQSLGVLPGRFAAAPPCCPEAPDELQLGPAQPLLSTPADSDHPGTEGPAHELSMDAFSIDRTPVTWARFLPFIEDGGYDDPRHWSAAGWSWRQRHTLGRPRHLSRDAAGHWRLAQFGQWIPVDPRWPAQHLSRHEALAWCRWAGRRLPTESEWEAAARQAGPDTAFHWGQVLEWTASTCPPPEGGEGPGAPAFPGPAQPTAPGVLRGASPATAPRLATVWARWAADASEHAGWLGFRSCAGTAQALDADEAPAAPASKPARTGRRRSASAAPPPAALTAGDAGAPAAQGELDGLSPAQAPAAPDAHTAGN